MMEPRPNRAGAIDQGDMMKRWALAAAGLAAAALVAAAALGAMAGRGGERAAADGITVQGDWKIEIKSPNGRTVRVHRFHNEFNGPGSVARILAHQTATGRYWLTLFNSAGSNNPCGSAGQAPCFDFEPDDPNAGIGDWFGSLAVSESSGALVIRSELEATRDGQFDSVRMLLSSCSASTAPSACHPGAYSNFSFRTLGSPVVLVAGQQVITTVTYTFSPA
jgi:hypothetical protein